MPPRRICLLGATGSIGRSTLDVIARHPERLQLVAVAARADHARMLEICQRFRPQRAVMSDPESAAALAAACRAAGLPTEVEAGPEMLVALAGDPATDTVVSAVVGAAGMAPTLAAAAAGKRLLLANKEALVVAGELLMRTVRESGCELLPLDSEHNAIFQCLPQRDGLARVDAGVRKVTLTASGGPFLDRSPAELAEVTPEQACAHPNWDMGRKVSVDSATLMNKGLEFIEACWLFDLAPRQVEVLVHPQSIVHSLVEYADGSVLAQLGAPDMRTPIAHALAWPERIASGVPALDLAAIGELTFGAPDPDRFPCLGLAVAAAGAGGAAPVVLNAADEIAVSAFLEGRLRFDRIHAVVDAALAAGIEGSTASVDELLALDGEARRVAQAALV